MQDDLLRAAALDQEASEDQIRKELETRVV